ncbi:MAG: DUF2723 domain-containing protein [Chloroflexi bacterium]|nr:DUF2723 domain-containing protein [Chloroflexota bacterium]
MRKTIASPALLAGAALWAAALALYLSTLAPTLTWGEDNIGVDGGELLAAAKTLGVPHPPGYPTYTLLLRGFATLVPVGDFAYRGNLMSAVLASLSVAMLYAVTLRLARRLRPEASSRLWILGAALAAAVFAASPLFWSQATITEVYTLNTLFAGLLLLIASRLALSDTSGRGDGRRLALFGFLLGVGLGNHLTLLAVAAPLLIWIGKARGWRFLKNPWAAGALALGLAIYLYVPIRAAQHPPVSWGDASTFDGFVWLVSGRAYQEYVFGVPPSALPGRLLAWVELVFKQFNPLGIFLGLVGAKFLYMYSRERRFLLASLSSIGLLGVYSIGYNTVDFQVLMIPAFMVFSIWVGIGFIGALETATAWARDKAFRLAAARAIASKPALVASVVAFAALPAASVALNYGPRDLSNDGLAFEYARSVLDSVPDGAVVLSTEETSAFSLWYMTIVESPERDVAAIAAPLLQFDWYWKSIRQQFPERVPANRPEDFAESLRSIVEHNAGDSRVFFTYREGLIADSHNLTLVGRLFEARPKGSHQ